MHIARVSLKSTEGSVYQQGQPFMTPRPDKETPDAHEERVWKDRGHWDANGNMIIPGIQFKRSLEAAAAYNPRKLRGNSTYTKLFEAAIIVPDNITLPIKRESVEGVRLYVSANGEKSSKVRGKATRVWRTFPTARQWSGTLDFYITDDRINESVFTDTLKDAGMFVGIGVWRPEKGGMNGRFTVQSVKWIEG